MSKTSTPVSGCGQPILGPSGVGKTKTSPVDINIQKEGKKLSRTEITYHVPKCQTCDQPFQPNSPRGHNCAVCSQVQADKKMPRMIIKNIRLEFISDDIIQTIFHEYPVIADLLTSNTNDKIKVITILKNDSKQTGSIILEVSPNIRKILIKGNRVKLGMCVYPIFDNLRLNLCSICMRTGHIAKYCRSLNNTCGICSLNHVTKTCQYFPIKLNRNEYKI